MNSMKKNVKTIYKVSSRLEKTNDIVCDSGIKITSAKKVVDSLRKIYEVEGFEIDYLEYFVVLFMNRQNKITGYSKISEGGTTGILVDGKVIFQRALLSNAAALILCHNHPSGNLSPSEPDLKLTRDVKNFGKLIDLPVLDHVILTEESFFSFQENGLI
jgi:DNA repair protein RadC